MSSVRDIKLATVDDLFSSEESRQAEHQQQGERIITVPISEVYDFAENPYRVRQDAELMDMVESIERLGVHTPCLARPRPDGGYELLSGHRRKLASTLAGKDTLPLIVRNIEDDAAIILVVDGNIQRETILPSEKAKAYKMKLEALKRKAGRPSKNYSQIGNNYKTKTSIEEMVQQEGGSKNKIYNYISLNELIPELLQMVDDKKIAFSPAVELSQIPQKLQSDLLSVILQEGCNPTVSQAQRLKEAAKAGKLDHNGMELVLQEEKPQQNNITIKANKLEKYFPKNYTPKQKEDMIIRALDLYHKRMERIRQEREHER